MYQRTLIFLCIMSFMPHAMAGAAATKGSITSHGGTITQGSSNVLIGGKPAARQGDFASCPVLIPLPHIGGSITIGSGTVLINGLPAARQGDLITEFGSVTHIVSGEYSVLIGG